LGEPQQKSLIFPLKPWFWTGVHKIKMKKEKIILKGLPASSGQARGRVKIVNFLKELGKLGKGDIMVASFLPPDFISFIKNNSRIAGIITDKGGVTCHAAIVTRELKIPYIAATFYATKKLKNNAEIAMDSKKGIVYEC